MRPSDRTPVTEYRYSGRVGYRPRHSTDSRANAAASSVSRSESSAAAPDWHSMPRQNIATRHRARMIRISAGGWQQAGCDLLGGGGGGDPLGGCSGDAGLGGCSSSAVPVRMGWLLLPLLVVWRRRR